MFVPQPAALGERDGARAGTWRGFPTSALCAVGVYPNKAPVVSCQQVLLTPTTSCLGSQPGQSALGAPGLLWAWHRSSCPFRNAPVLEVRFKALGGGTGSPVTGDIFEAERSCGMR